jgi:hypothetical protein
MLWLWNYIIVSVYNVYFSWSLFHIYTCSRVPLNSYVPFARCIASLRCHRFLRWYFWTKLLRVGSGLTCCFCVLTRNLFICYLNLFNFWSSINISFIFIRNCRLCSSGYQTARFAFVACLRVVGKQTRLLCKPNTLPTLALGQRATKYCRCEGIFTGRTVCALASAACPNSLSVCFFF